MRIFSFARALMAVEESTPSTAEVTRLVVKRPSSRYSWRSARQTTRSQKSASTCGAALLGRRRWRRIALLRWRRSFRWWWRWPFLRWWWRTQRRRTSITAFEEALQHGAACNGPPFFYVVCCHYERSEESAFVSTGNGWEGTADPSLPEGRS